MTRLPHTAVLMLAVTIGATSVTAIDSLTNHAQASSSAARPDPNFKGKRTTWGSTITGSASGKGRLNAGKPQRPDGKPQTKKTKATKPTATKSRARTQSASSRRELRLNTGICGRVQTDGTIPGPNRCGLNRERERRVELRTIPPDIVRPRPQDVTWEQVRSETKNIMFPGLSVKVQPNGRTLVNLDTIVYTDDSKVSTTTVTLLGFPVVVEATPISYTWSFGDGSPALTTTTPGKPYPSKEITHKYMKRGNVSLTLTTNYAARYNVADTGWQYIDGTVPITGPATPLQIREAIPVLVDPDR